MTSRTWSRVSGHRMISKLESDGTEGSLGWANEGSQAVLTANTDESEPELAWADPRWRDLRRSFRHWRSTEPQRRLHRGSSLSRSCQGSRIRDRRLSVMQSPATSELHRH